MKELFQAVDIKKWGSKIISSVLIVSMLMIDVAKAMEEEHDPRLSKVIHSPLSLKLQSADQDIVIEVIEDFSPRQNSSFDEVDSSTGSISTSPEKLTPEEDKSLILSPFASLSLVFPQSKDVSAPQQMPDEIKSQPSFMTILSDPLAFRAEERHPQLQLSSSMSTSLGSSPMRAASLQERSPPFIPSSQSVAESNQDNGQSAASFPNYILTPADYDPLGSGSDSDSAEDAGIFFLGTQPDRPRSSSIPIKTKRDLSSAPVFSERRTPSESSRLLQSLSLTYSSIQADDDRRDYPSPSLPLGDPEDHDLPAIEDSSKCCSWCPDRPLWPEPTKYTLPDSLNAIKKRSEFFLSPRPNHQAISSDSSTDSFSLEVSDSSSPHGSPEKTERGDGIAPSTDEDSEDSDDPDVTFGNPPPAILEDQSFINLQSPVDVPIGTSMSASIAPAHLSVLSDHDLEDGTASTTASSHARPLSPEEALTRLLEDIIDLSAKIKARLKETYKDLNGDITRIDCVGILIGILVGCYYAYGLGPVYIGGIAALGNLNEVFNKFVNGYAASYFIDYIMYSALPDGIARNVHLWKKGLAYLFSQKNKEVGRICIATPIATVSALVPFSFLVFAENIGRERLQLPWKSGFGTAVIVRGIPLVLDDFAKVVDITMNNLPKLEDWFRQFGQVFFPSSFPPQMKSFEATQREKFDHSLTKLKHFLVGASDSVIEAIYQDVQDVIAGARSEEDLAAQKTFAAVSYLLSLGYEVQEVAKRNAKKSIAELAFEGLKYFGLIFGAPTTALLLQFVGSTVASLFTSNTFGESSMIADSIGEGFAFVAFLPFSYVLAQSMDNFKKRVFNKDPQGDESHPGVRLPVKIFIGLQSLLYLFPTCVAVLQSYGKWFGESWGLFFAAGFPLYFLKFVGVIESLNDTLNKKVTTAAINVSHRIGGRCRGSSLCIPCQRDDLTQFIKSIQSNLEYWDPILIHNLTKGVEIFKNGESNFSFDDSEV